MYFFTCLPTRLSIHPTGRISIGLLSVHSLLLCIYLRFAPTLWFYLSCELSHTRFSPRVSLVLSFSSKRNYITKSNIFNTHQKEDIKNITHNIIDEFSKYLLCLDVLHVFVSFCVLVFVLTILSWCL